MYGILYILMSNSYHHETSDKRVGFPGLTFLLCITQVFYPRFSTCGPPALPPVIFFVLQTMHDILAPHETAVTWVAAGWATGGRIKSKVGGELAGLV